MPGGRHEGQAVAKSASWNWASLALLTVTRYKKELTDGTWSSRALIDFAESHDVNERVLGEIRRLPGREYVDMEDVAAECGPMP